MLIECTCLCGCLRAPLWMFAALMPLASLPGLAAFCPPAATLLTLWLAMVGDVDVTATAVGSLSGNYLGPDGAQALVSRLGKLTQLQTLNLEGENCLCPASAIACAMAASPMASAMCTCVAIACHTALVLLWLTLCVSGMGGHAVLPATAVGRYQTTTLAQMEHRNWHHTWPS